MSTVHAVVPEGIDDPASPSGGNAYDRRVCSGLAELGWSVVEHPVPGSWPAAGTEARAALATALATLPEGAVVLLDGLIACAAPEVLVPQAARLRMVVLVHMLLGQASGEGGGEARSHECVALSAAAAVITTSRWIRDRTLQLYRLPGDRVHVAVPGVDTAGQACGTEDGGELLCVAAVIPAKGHDVLLAALARLTDRRWHLSCVGSMARDPDFLDGLLRQARASGIGDRVSFTGPLTVAALFQRYAEADLLVLASHHEGYGMVVVEALAHGIPVVATDVGGLPEALGHLPPGCRPGALVAPGDVTALAEALAGWLDEADLRDRWRRDARERRAHLAGWAVTVDRVSRVLAGVAR